MNARQGESTVAISAGEVTLEGALHLPAQPTGAVVFSHGSGSGRFSPRNQFVAAQLHKLAMGTLLLDLLTEVEDRDYERRFDIDLLTQRLGHAVRFVRSHAATKTLPVGLFGASTGAASALQVAAVMPKDVSAVVSRGGRPDLAGAAALKQVRAPTLLIVGGLDFGVIELNESARDMLTQSERELVIVPGATHLFEEPGTLDEVARLAGQWFIHHLVSIPTRLDHAQR
jgi:pimeloyl-ACP methyl ester carboxylesterase